MDGLVLLSFSFIRPSIKWKRRKGKRLARHPINWLISHRLVRYAAVGKGKGTSIFFYLLLGHGHTRYKKKNWPWPESKRVKIKSFLAASGDRRSVATRPHICVPLGTGQEVKFLKKSVLGQELTYRWPLCGRQSLVLDSQDLISSPFLVLILFLSYAQICANAHHVSGTS